MKKNYLQNRGFVLAETLVVAVAVTAIFALVFKHFYPLIGEYEKRENYDDIDSLYGTFWFKRIISNSSYNLTIEDTNQIQNNGYTMFSCDKITDITKQNMCKQLLVSLEVSCDDITTKEKIEYCAIGLNRQPHIYITSYNLTNFKEKTKSSEEITSGLREYVNYLPTFAKVSNNGVSINGAQYHIIIEYYRHRFDTVNYRDNNLVEDDTSYIVDSDNDFLSYAKIEVKK